MYWRVGQNAWNDKLNDTSSSIETIESEDSFCKITKPLKKLGFSGSLNTPTHHKHAKILSSMTCDSAFYTPRLPVLRDIFFFEKLKKNNIPFDIFVDNGWNYTTDVK